MIKQPPPACVNEQQTIKGITAHRRRLSMSVYSKIIYFTIRTRKKEKKRNKTKQGALCCGIVALLSSY